MIAAHILFVVFQFQRNALLAHEHPLAYAARIATRFAPVTQADGE